jgi:lipoprotein-anchoring transpeptidase ErfK/SrfK
LGLPAIVIACLLLVAAPVLADTPAPDTTSAETSVPTTTDPATTSPSEPLASQPGAITGPASTPGALPTRGPQVQLTPPPPSPFDPPIDGGNGRRVVYSKSQQTVWAYDENNTIIKMHRVSGRQDPRDPLPGTYKVWSRSIRTFSINNPTITWNYMVRFAKGDRDGNIGFHDIPYQYGQPVQTIDQLGQALSGGCVRQASEDAIWMWNWAQIGTVVVVTP